MNREYNHSKLNRMYKNSKIAAMVGFIAIAAGLIYALVGLTGNLEVTENTMDVLSAVVLMLAICAGGGLILLFFSIKMKKTGDAYKKYIAAVIDQNYIAIDNIAVVAGVTYETALNDLYKMIKSGYFPGLTVNEHARKLIVKEETNGQNVEAKAAYCKGCGSYNIMPVGRMIECEYCNSSLEI